MVDLGAFGLMDGDRFEGIYPNLEEFLQLKFSLPPELVFIMHH